MNPLRTKLFLLNFLLFNLVVFRRPSFRVFRPFQTSTARPIPLLRSLPHFLFSHRLPPFNHFYNTHSKHGLQILRRRRHTMQPAGAPYEGI